MHVYKVAPPRKADLGKCEQVVREARSVLKSGWMGGAQG